MRLIPIALWWPESKYDSACEWIRGVFRFRKVRSIVTWTRLDGHCSAELADFEGIYFLMGRCADRR